jgi:hypothetical protein
MCLSRHCTTSPAALRWQSAGLLVVCALVVWAPAFTDTRRVELTVYDLVGRRVARLAEATLAAGLHDVEWDGRDGASQVVASGSYVVHLRTERAVDARRLTLVR